MSLKSRLVAVAAIWIITGMIIAGFMLSAHFRLHVKEQFIEELYVHLDELERLAEVTPSGARLQRSLSDPRYDVLLSGYYWEIQKGGSVFARSQSLQGATLKTPTDDIKDVGVHTHVIDGPTGKLLVAEQARWTAPSEQPLRYIIGTDNRHIDTVLQHFNQTLAWSMALFGAVMIGAASLLIMIAMRPLDHLRLSLASVRSGQKKALEGRFPNEVQPLVDDLNALLRSTNELVQRARTQAGNIAHGLKTPLAILTDEADRIDAQGMPQSAKTILEQCRKMQSKIDYQITRARAVALRSAPGTAASAHKAAGEVASALERLHRPSGLIVENTIDPTYFVACDHHDLNEMLANLVDNACKHAKSCVRLSSSRSPSGNGIVISVEDDGPGLPPEAFDVVFNVGERWDSQKPGAGLGLAIVLDLARLYGGDAKLTASALGGLRVDLELPERSRLSA
ncbi:MAG: HAMP domain-containing sensor histidine kinase [Hyphomicrobiaceae bacterium]